jgi:heme/copper-type cytochrome/quinol oxidase subunit 3
MAFQIPMATKRSATGIPTGRLAVWWVLASEIFIFGGLIASYLMFRLHHDHWAGEAANTNTIAGAINTVVLLTSSLSVVLAHAAAERKQTDRAAMFLWFTIAGAGMFLVVKAYEYTTEIGHGFHMFRDVFWSFYYTATGLHAIHVIAGAIIMGIVANAVKKGQHLQRVEYIGIYWHFVDVVWIFLFPLLYIAK